MSVPELQPGDVFGAYEIAAFVGAGGMGQVYRARHRTLERDVALKIVGPHLAQDRPFVDRLLKEARAAARLNHPNIVQIYDVGEAHGRFFLVLEYVVGRSLGQRLRETGPLPVGEAVTLAAQAALALAVAHDAGLVHRDVKPDNLLLADSGTLKLIDLGLAKHVDPLGPETTATAGFAGTPHYMAPEQIRGRRDLDGRADVYALGATLFHLVCGCTPCAAEDGAGAVIAAHLEGNLLDPLAVAPGLPPALCAILRRMTARDREQRYPDMRAVLRELAALRLDDAAALPTVVLAPPRPALDPSALDSIERLLASAVGPVARVLVKQTARDAADTDDLCQRLAAHVSAPAERERFLAKTRALGPGHSGAGPATPSAAAPASFAPDDLARIERALAFHVGPVARVLVRRAAARATSRDALVDALAEHVPEPARVQFRSAAT